MKLNLVVLSAGQAEGKKLAIPLAQFLIGRDPQCHLRPVSELISKRHCAVIKKDNQVFVRDFGSLNGTFVNDEKVEGQRELKNDDILKAGPLLFRVELEGASPSVNTNTPLPENKKPEESQPQKEKVKTNDSTGGGDDEEMAAMLLSTLDGDEPVLTPSTGDENEVPGGTTMMDMPALDDTNEQPKAEETKEEPEEPKMNSAQAAAAALANMTRRRRSN